MQEVAAEKCLTMVDPRKGNDPCDCSSMTSIYTRGCSSDPSFYLRKACCMYALNSLSIPESINVSGALRNLSLYILFAFMTTSSE